MADQYSEGAITVQLIGLQRVGFNGNLVELLKDSMKCLRCAELESATRIVEGRADAAKLKRVRVAAPRELAMESEEQKPQLTHTDTAVEVKHELDVDTEDWKYALPPSSMVKMDLGEEDVEEIEVELECAD